MGLFSFNCLGCGHPFLMPGVTNDTNRWMSKVVELDGQVTGVYDGYGRLEEATHLDTGRSAYGEEVVLSICPGPKAYHCACWAAAGMPLQSDETCESSADQGYFFAEGTHDMPEPKALDNLPRKPSPKPASAQGPGTPTALKKAREEGLRAGLKEGLDELWRIHSHLSGTIAEVLDEEEPDRGTLSALTVSLGHVSAAISRLQRKL